MAWACNIITTHCIYLQKGHFFPACENVTVCANQWYLKNTHTRKSDPFCGAPSRQKINIKPSKILYSAIMERPFPQSCGLKDKLKHLSFSGRARPWHCGSRCVLGLNNVVKMKPCKAEGSGVEESNRESELSAHPLSITSSDQSVLVKCNFLCHGPPLCGVISPKGRLDFDWGWSGPSLQRGEKWRTFHQQFRFLDSQVSRTWYKNVSPVCALNYFQIKWSFMYSTLPESCLLSLQW